MHLRQRIAIHFHFHFFFSVLFPSHFSPHFSFLLYSFLVCAAYGPFASIGHPHLSIHHPSIYPFSTISSHRLRFISLYFIFFPRLFFHAFFYRVFSMLRFISHLRLILFLFASSHFSCPLLSILAGFLSSGTIHGSGSLSQPHIDVELERKGGVVSGRLDVPHFDIVFTPLALSFLLIQSPTPTIRHTLTRTCLSIFHLSTTTDSHSHFPPRHISIFSTIYDLL
ncbi:hypothetical protein M413DRAFT_81244 [Hebeloma cylindrosporum]|uniref:Uncharacterized protein n=1 Tax=Hebeloma cylindrosporum TaxID=76867 RepID=A0A0C3CIK1_HEBCY|nr:hypothetical protein M413DRAFT_81244 [Hebeloma cylindrosporum h7]